MLNRRKITEWNYWYELLNEVMDMWNCVVLTFAHRFDEKTLYSHMGIVGPVLRVSGICYALENMRNYI